MFHSEGEIRSSCSLLPVGTQCPRFTLLRSCPFLVLVPRVHEDTRVCFQSLYYVSSLCVLRYLNTSHFYCYSSWHMWKSESMMFPALFSLFKIAVGVWTSWFNILWVNLFCSHCVSRVYLERWDQEWKIPIVYAVVW